MKIVSRGDVYRGQPGGDEQSTAFPSIAVLDTGRWLSTFRPAPRKSLSGGTLYFTWSDDQGDTWAKPIAPFEPMTVDGMPGSFRGGYVTAMDGKDVLAVINWVDQTDPSLPLFNPRTEGILDMKPFLSWSHDCGETWSKPQRVDMSPYDQPTPLTGPIVRLANGELALSFELNKRFHETHTWRHNSVLKFSPDGGKTWPEYGVVTADPENRYFLWDQRVSVLPDGRVLDLFWTYDNNEAVYLEIHARMSENHGRTWSPLWRTGLPGQPAQPVGLADGRVVVVYVDRTDEPIVKLRVSSDDARTFPADTELVLYSKSAASQTERKGSMQDAWSEMGKFSVGLPNTTLIGDNDLLAVYYAGPHADETGIEWVRVAL